MSEENEVLTEEVVEKPVPELKEAEVVEEVVKEKPVETKGVKETKELLKLSFVLAKLYKMAKGNDGHLGAGDLALLAGAFPEMGDAFEGITEVPAELKDLSMEEVKQLLIFSAAHLGDSVESKELELKLEKGLAAAIAIVEFIKVMK